MSGLHQSAIEVRQSSWRYIFMGSLTIIALSLFGATVIVTRSFGNPVVASVARSPFENESAQALDGWTFENAGYWRANDMHGAYYNNVDGHRITAQNGHGTHIYILGNSVTYGYWLSDTDTVPSALQDMLLDRQIVNLGAIPSTSIQQFAQLQQVPLRLGDTVIVLGGVSEATAFYNGAVTEKKTATDIAAALIPHYEQAIVRSSDYVRRQGARFIYLLQPVVFSSAMSSKEKALADAINPAQNQSMALTWPSLETMIARLLARGIEAHDWTHALDKYRHAGKLAYLDFCHFTPDSARYVANLTSALIRQEF